MTTPTKPNSDSTNGNSSEDDTRRANATTTRPRGWPRCRTRRRSRDFDARISSDTEGREATTREERHRGAYPTRRKTRKWMGPTADVSSSTEVDGTYRRCVERHKGQGTPTPTS